MKNLVLVKRYCLGLLGAVHSEEEYASVLEELVSFAQLLAEQKDLNLTLLTPFLPASRKIKVADEILRRLSLQPKVVRFILLLLENERLELLPDILELLPDLWNEAQGVVTFEVFSVVPLKPAQEKTLRIELENIEQRPVALKFHEDPSLIGGISLRKGNVVYDVSLKGSLEQLREKIIEG
jgi:F-type H+-transporting ATPase subunit delta